MELSSETRNMKFGRSALPERNAKGRKRRESNFFILDRKEAEDGWECKLRLSWNLSGNHRVICLKAI